MIVVKARFSRTSRRIAALGLLALAIKAYLWLSQPIPHPNITGGKVVLILPSGARTEYVLAGLADESGLVLVATTGETFDLDGSQDLKVVYTSGKEKFFGNFREPKP